VFLSALFEPWCAGINTLPPVQCASASTGDLEAKSVTEAIKIWGRKTSSNVQKVLWILDELDLDYEHIGADAQFGQASTPEYRAMNPNGLVPVMQHGDLMVWESHAIMRYLAATFGEGTLWQTSPAARAPINQWEIWAVTSLIPAISKVFYAIVRAAPSKRDPKLIGETVAAASSALKILDDQLAKSKYVAGDAFSLADIPCASLMFRWETMEIDRPNLPNVARWMELIKQRPGYQKWGTISYDSLRILDD
jgi:glutathione S-transferase